MNKYIFRVIFYVTVVLSYFAFSIDYNNPKFLAILLLWGTVAIGCTISYKVLRGKTNKEISEILGIPESFISE